jgi:hypothetical protein
MERETSTAIRDVGLNVNSTLRYFARIGVVQNSFCTNTCFDPFNRKRSNVYEYAKTYRRVEIYYITGRICICLNNCKRILDLRFSFYDDYINAPSLLECWKMYSSFIIYTNFENRKCIFQPFRQSHQQFATLSWLVKSALHCHSSGVRITS